jgi:hypothetical protein
MFRVALTVDSRAMGSTRHARSFWEVLLAEVDRGESQDVVARRHQVRPRTLQWWCWRLRREASGAKERVPRLVPVVVRQGLATPIVERASAEVAVLVADVRVHFQVGADIGYVTALVAALRRSC